MSFAMNDNKSSILITTLWIMAILSLLAMGIGFRSSIEVRLTKYNMDELEARYAAKAGIVKAREFLSSDRKEDYDTLYECGISLKINETPESIFSPNFNKLGNGRFCVFYRQKSDIDEKEYTYYGMADEERKINIKLSCYQKKEDYKNILKRLSPDLTDEIISAMVDWQDSDSEASTPGGAENTYYSESLEHPYGCKNGDFELVEELLLVKGITREIFNEIKDNVTVYTEGKININTASREVLNAILNDEGDAYPNLADKIIHYRRGFDGKETTKDDRPIKDLGTIPNVEPGESARLTQVADYFIFKADNFRITSHGEVHKIGKIITCVVGRENEEIKYYHEE
ncbi:MAG: general secretion pathway protein GspK [Candidatus Omnitrophica bacterium]|nr:general secretion pathway protein GspK [Candidatus Omnitrophota bacterium]